jgi:hypothetical protein
VCDTTTGIAFASLQHTLCKLLAAKEAATSHRTPSCTNPKGRGCLHRIYQSSPCRYTSHCCGHAVLAASETLSFRATHGLLTSYPYKKSIEPLNDSEHDSASDKPCHSISIVGCQRTHPLIVGISQRIRHAVWAFETVGFQRRGATRKGPG